MCHSVGQSSNGPVSLAVSVTCQASWEFVTAFSNTHKTRPARCATARTATQLKLKSRRANGI